MIRILLISVFILPLVLSLAITPVSAQQAEDDKKMMDGEMMDKPEMTDKKDMMEKVNINKADMDQLMMLPGVGEDTAKKIIDYRNTNGEFKTLDQLKSIPGIGEKKYEKMKDMLTM